MLGANVASAGIPQVSLAIQTGFTNPNIEIFDCGAKFNQVSNYIGWTGEDTKVCLGEVDFGADGNKYKAASIDLANGWYCDGFAILHAGADYESSVPFTQIALNETGGYDNFVTYATNLSCNIPQEQWSNGPAMENIEYVKPTGKQKVYLTFVLGAGNIRAVNFYEQELKPEDFKRNFNEDGTPGLDDMIALLAPDDYPEYADMSIRLNSTESVAMNPDEFPDARLDGESWGWTNNGFLADYGNVDFGNGDYKQAVINFTHWSENLADYIELYIDEVAEANMLASFWCGRNLEGKVYINLAKNIKAVNGTHKVIAKWLGGSINLHHIDFVKDDIWPIATDCGIVIEDVQPEADALHIQFEGNAEGVAAPWNYAVRCKGQYEGAGNIGYTKNGTVIEFFDVNGDGVDLGDGSYKRIVVNHASEPSYMGPIEQSNFKFYTDLDPDMMYSDEDFDQNLDDILADHEPFCTVRLQGTGAWSVRKKTAGAITRPVSGKHNVFMVYTSTYNTSGGANVFDIYLDKAAASSVDAIAKDNTDNGVNVYTSEGEIIVVADMLTNVEIFSLNGQRLAAAMVEGENTLEVAPGFYLVRASNANGAVSFKVIVK